MADYEGTMNEHGVIEVAEAQVMPVPSTDALGVIEGAAIDLQISTARAYPRSVEKFRRDALSLAVLDEETAGSCFYAIPRDGKMIEGPSVRLAEIAAYAWGNIRVEARIQAIEEKQVIAVGTALDLERNNLERVEVPRSIVTSKGKRYGADMINVTCRAALAIARREAIFAVIPRAYINPIYRQARRASIGEGGTIEQERQKALGWFKKIGIDPERIYHTLGVKGMADIGEDELISLRGIRTAIQDGDILAETAFPRIGAIGNEDSRDLNEMLRKGAAPAVDLAGPSTPGAAPTAATDTGAGEPVSHERSGDAERVEAAPEPTNHFWEKPWRLDEPPPVLEYLADQLAAINRLDTLDRLETAERAKDNRKTALDRIGARRRVLENGKAQADLTMQAATDQQTARIKALLNEREVEEGAALRIYQRLARDGFNEPDAADVISMLEELPAKSAVTA